MYLSVDRWVKMIIIKDEQWIQQRNFQSHSQLKMIKSKIFNAILKKFLTSSLRQVEQDDKSGALLQRKKIPTNRRKNTVMLLLFWLDQIVQLGKEVKRRRNLRPPPPKKK